MGYLTRIVDSNFHIASSDKKAALSAARSLIGAGTMCDCHHIPPRYPHSLHTAEGRPRFPWVDVGEFAEARSLEEVLDVWGFKSKVDRNGNIVGVAFPDAKWKIGSAEILLRMIAPYVRRGSFIELEGEDGEHWRWRFNGGLFKKPYMADDSEQA